MDQKELEGDLIEEFADISTAQAYKAVIEIPGYKLRKPLEMALFEDKDLSGQVIGYRAVHWLPSEDYKGKEIAKVGKTEEEAAKKVISTLITRYESLCASFKTNTLPPFLEKEKQYLDAILEKEGLR